MKEIYLFNMISPPFMVRIHCPCGLSLFSILQGYWGAAWQFLVTMKCHLGKNYLSYDTIEGLSLQQLRNSTYLDNCQPKSGMTDIQ